MADNPFDRQVINIRERPLSTDINLGQTQLDLAAREFAMRTFLARSSDQGALGWLPNIPAPAGFIHDGYIVRPVSPVAMQVIVRAGLGWYPNATDVPSGIGSPISVGVDDPHSYKPLTLTADQVLNVPAADPTNPRIDIIEVTYDRRLENSSSRDVFSTTALAFIPGAVFKTLADLARREHGGHRIQGGYTIRRAGRTECVAWLYKDCRNLCCGIGNYNYRGKHS